MQNVIVQELDCLISSPNFIQETMRLVTLLLQQTLYGQQQQQQQQQPPQLQPHNSSLGTLLSILLNAQQNTGLSLVINNPPNPVLPLLPLFLSSFRGGADNDMSATPLFPMQAASSQQPLQLQNMAQVPSSSQSVNSTTGSSWEPPPQALLQILASAASHTSQQQDVHPQQNISPSSFDDSQSFLNHAITVNHSPLNRGECASVTDKEDDTACAPPPASC
jgi:hypothetical protein